MWFTDSLESYLFGGVETLDEACGLNGKNGSRKAKTVLLLEIRDNHLLKAWELVSDDEKLSSWGRSQRLSKEVSKFCSIVWPRVRYFDEPPENYNEFKKSLFYAVKYGGGKLPGKKPLHEIIKNALPPGLI